MLLSRQVDPLQLLRLAVLAVAVAAVCLADVPPQLTQHITPARGFHRFSLSPRFSLYKPLPLPLRAFHA